MGLSLTCKTCGETFDSGFGGDPAKIGKLDWTINCKVCGAVNHYGHDDFPSGDPKPSETTLKEGRG